MTHTVEINVDNLNEKTIDLWEMIEARKGVVMLRGKAGVAKSATCKFIADNVLYNGQPLKFIDLRLSQMDETHFGFPYREKAHVGNWEVMKYALPKWFQEACDTPVLINFEELNRCSQDVQNAALEVLNERTLHGVKLPDHVFMIATGNMGEADGCAVQDFDNALINRLIMVDFDLTYEEWREYFAEENVAPYIVDFLADHKDQHFYSSEDYFKDPDNEGKPFASPRSWTNLSESLFEQDNEREMIDFVKERATSFVGHKSAQAFHNWLRDLYTVSFEKIVNGQLHTRYFENDALKRQLAEIRKAEKKGEIRTGNLTKKQKERYDNLLEEYNV